MISFRAKEDGKATIPLLGMMIFLSIIITIVYITYDESQKINERTDDAVTMSIQGSCLFDRYEYANGVSDGQNVVCFYSGLLESRYSDTDHAYNMELTKSACSYAYGLYKDILTDNLSMRYVIMPDESSGGIGQYVKKFEMVNVRDGIAYIYDCINGSSTIVPVEEKIKSTLEVTMEMDLDFPFYGVKSITFNKTGKLESRVR